ncbi:NUDIX domain-containing protein [Candidatus Woesearchaeota archaeon]|nr:NUDIX domain-containing protein [Candidatus Woesearchaeota archaeon]
MIDSKETGKLTPRPGIAVKALVVSTGKILIVKRRPDDVQKPGVWEIPGGRLSEGENPFMGLQREVKEETGLEIEVKNPLDVDYFVRADNQTITMLIFLCSAKNDNVILSEEHTDYKWCNIDEVKDHLVEFFHKSVDNYIDHFKE